LAKTEGDAGKEGGGIAAAAEEKMLDFAEDLGKILGLAQVRARGWLDQRKALVSQLAGVRDTATLLLHQLGESGSNVVAVVRAGKRGRPPGSKNKTAGKRGRPPAKQTKIGRPPGKKKKGGMSAAGRAAIAKAQRERWARLKAAKVE
jgi:hypothetical protein